MCRRRSRAGPCRRRSTLLGCPPQIRCRQAGQPHTGPHLAAPCRTWLHKRRGGAADISGASRHLCIGCSNYPTQLVGLGCCNSQTVVGGGEGLGEGDGGEEGLGEGLGLGDGVVNGFSPRPPPPPPPPPPLPLLSPSPPLPPSEGGGEEGGEGGGEGCRANGLSGVSTGLEGGSTTGVPMQAPPAQLPCLQ